MPRTASHCHEACCYAASVGGSILVALLEAEGAKVDLILRAHVLVLRVELGRHDVQVGIFFRYCLRGSMSAAVPCTDGEDASGQWPCASCSKQDSASPTPQWVAARHPLLRGCPRPFTGLATRGGYWSYALRNHHFNKLDVMAMPSSCV